MAVKCESTHTWDIHCNTEQETLRSYVVLDPVAFRVGDIVEAQVSFVGVPLKGEKVRMMVVLRALTLLDCNESMVSE